MADEREPPPLSGLEQQENSLFYDNDEDLFASVVEVSLQSSSTQSNAAVGHLSTESSASGFFG